MPALQEFPIKLWATIVSKQARSLTTQSLVDGDARGHALLRCAIAEYLGSARGVRCTEAQVLVLASVQQGLDLATRLLLDEGDLAWCEDPGYAGAVAGFRAAGIAPCPIPVDEYGMDVAWAERRHPTARMAYVTPAHQAPLGVSLSLPRRLTLLDWARRRKAWIFEDDYDSEYRYSGKPLPPLQSLDENDCVLYAGCFSKTLFPALRIAYLVIPVGFADAFAAARSVTSRYPPVLDQLVLAEFMREGHYARHLRRMRQLYAERRSLLVKLVNQRLANKLEVMNNATGLNLVCWLTQGLSQDALLERCKSSGLAVHALSRYSAEWKRRQRDGLVLGFASMTAPAIRIAVGKLAGALDC
ncbi:MAG: PLP-dependent aminotransferase family protein [Caldimonas sp.]